MLDINEQQRLLKAWLEQHALAASLCIFGFSSLLSETSKNDFTAAAKDFFSQWQAHKVSLSSDFFLFCDQFLWVAVDPSVTLSGCARDSLSRFVQNYCIRQPNISLMDANDVALLQFEDMKKEKGHFILVRRYALSDFFRDKTEDDLKKISVVNLHFSRVKQGLSEDFFVPYLESYLSHL